MSCNAVGFWTIKMTTPMGAQEGTLRIEESDDGIGGVITVPPLGDMPLRDVQADGNDIAWSVKLKAPWFMTGKCTAKVDGDSIRGQMSSRLGTGEIEGTRTSAG
ncbi:hypothetical protein [Mycobacterium palustre]|nr:hypothetical protein [Mycobacterium palustre]